MGQCSFCFSLLDYWFSRLQFQCLSHSKDLYSVDRRCDRLPRFEPRLREVFSGGCLMSMGQQHELSMCELVSISRAVATKVKLLNQASAYETFIRLS
mmetsp:Transcript_64622/g.210769  ORF Transcript_64622/g.210769 Transcript_64622/m.210769 type:complete len:97 (-) Transcript_64622:55-345(-)